MWISNTLNLEMNLKDFFRWRASDGLKEQIREVIMCIVSLLLSAQKRIAQVLNHLQSPLLLLFRVYWGWQFFETGQGKLANIGDVTGFFVSLGIPFPAMTAHLVGLTELIGGALLILGLFSRLIAIPLTITMIVAYLTADLSAVTGLFSDPDAFVKAAPFPFLITSLLILVFGSGYISLDHLFESYAAQKNMSCCNQMPKRDA